MLSQESFAQSWKDTLRSLKNFELVKYLVSPRSTRKPVVPADSTLFLLAKRQRTLLATLLCANESMNWTTANRHFMDCGC